MEQAYVGSQVSGTVSKYLGQSAYKEQRYLLAHGKFQFMAGLLLWACDEAVHHGKGMCGSPLCMARK